MIINIFKCVNIGLTALRIKSIEKVEREMNIQEGLLIFQAAAQHYKKMLVLQEWVKNEEHIKSLVACTELADVQALFCEVMALSCEFVDFMTFSVKAKRVLASCDAAGIQILIPYDGFFPLKILSIKTPPILLFVKGDPHALLGDSALAVVGTRHSSAIGLAFTKKIIPVLIEHEVCVVSGLAVGCDTLAHEAALIHHGKTVAVLAHGLDMIYPPQNAGLAKRITSSGGCLVSEYPPGVKPEKYRFVERNRIQSGLSSGVIVIESEEAGGTMHTARFCLAQSKPIACMALTAPAMTGNIKLLKEGAFPVRGESEALEFLRINKLMTPKRDEPLRGGAGAGSSFFKKSPEFEDSPERLRTELKVQNNKLKALQILLSKRETSGEKRVTLANSLAATQWTISEIEATLKAYEVGSSSATLASAAKRPRG